jgi:hypothetical protein
MTKFVVWAGMSCGFFLFAWMDGLHFGLALDKSFVAGSALATLALAEWLKP